MSTSPVAVCRNAGNPPERGPAPPLSPKPRRSIVSTCTPASTNCDAMPDHDFRSMLHWWMSSIAGPGLPGDM